MSEPAETCYACRLSSGREPLPGGRIAATDLWVVEHCTGPLGVGSLILKPLRHCVHLWELRDEEAAELGPMIRRVSEAVRELCEADQVYCCLWSHAGFEPGHIHFVVQPAWNASRDRYPGPGPRTQMAMFDAKERPDPEAVEALCRRARARLS